ncbi:hypothetical protein AGLY_001175 [Aphis glycines]|uniref:Uncharacterized protein n=1 Tax=Aphis glycines TaxID=307491 RepID=A0A6G0UBC8_APHGL|nr:hypothetical protein AGLY_001175 [Aphis glycines]
MTALHPENCCKSITPRPINKPPNESCIIDNSWSTVPYGPRKYLKDKRAFSTFPFMRWKFGLSGIKIIRATYTIGIIAQIRVNKIPAVTCNWKYVPKVPRISFSAISEVYRGTITDNDPLANPVKNSAHIIIAQPISVGMHNINIMFLRPNLSTRPAVTGHPSMAPSGIHAPIHARLSLEIMNGY